MFKYISDCTNEFNDIVAIATIQKIIAIVLRNVSHTYVTCTVAAVFSHVCEGCGRRRILLNASAASLHILSTSYDHDLLT